MEAAGGATRPLPFGRAAAETVAALQRTGRAEPRRSTNPECGAGPLAFADWPDGFQLVFQDDRFVGWSTRQVGLQTMSGVGVGSTRAQLEAAYKVTVEETTLGQEFQAGGLGGLLSGPGPDARITNLWAGITCAFR